MIDIPNREFELVVESALRELPSRFADLLENVAIVVEEEPTEEERGALADRNHELLGLYRGIPMTERTHDLISMPDRIAIFRRPILRVARNRREAVRQIRDTVIHELGHYFGLDDEGMAY